MYKSKAQQRYMHAAAARGEIKPSVVHEFDEATKRKKGGFSSLPEHLAKGGEAKLGTGKRFEHLTHELAGKGAHDPGALAAWIGRKKYGNKKMAKLSAHGRKMSEGGIIFDDEDAEAGDQNAEEMSERQANLDEDFDRGHAFAQALVRRRRGY